MLGVQKIQETFEVSIEVIGSWKDKGNGSLSKKDSILIIKDNGSGIKDIGKFAIPAATSNPLSKGVNRHGMGAKNALSSLGARSVQQNGTSLGLGGFEILTKLKEDKEAKVFSRLSYRGIPYQKLSEKETNDLFPESSGTIIKIFEPKVPVRTQDYFDQLIAPLGVRYQMPLQSGGFQGKSLKLTVSLLDSNGKIKESGNNKPHTYNVASFPPGLAGNGKWIINLHPFKGDSCKVRMSFGLAMDQSELDNLSDKEHIFLSQKDTSNPYHINKGVVDFIHRGIVICQEGPECIYGRSAATRFFRNGYPRFQIYLDDGFDTTIVKNDFLRKAFEDEIRDQIKEHEHIKKHIKQSFYDDKESQLCDRLEKVVKRQSPNYKRNAPVIAGVLNKPDFILNDVETLWEVKKDEAGEDAVYQLFAYLMQIKWKKGEVIADSFGHTAQYLADFYNKEYGLEIKLTLVSEIL